jgi:MATE family multidrug resistance protein
MNDPAPLASPSLASPLLSFELPASRRDAAGRRRVSYRAVLALAMPLFINSGLQAVLSLTGAWFIGRLSTEATAALGAVYYLVLVFMLLFGGVAMAVLPLVAQAYGSRRRFRAARAGWMGVWAACLTAPLFFALAFAGPWLLAPFRLPQGIESLALEYWWPRMLGGPIGVAVWALSSFFNGIGRTRITLLIALVEAVVNAALNEIFMFRLGLGMAGSAWATTASLLIGLLVSLAILLRRDFRREYKSHLLWRPQPRVIGRLLVLGLPMGLSGTVDLFGLSLFQLMQVKLGPVSGAASQLAMMLTSLAFMPAIGFSLAGTTLVGQSIGAGDRDWASRVGNAVIKLCVGYMGAVGVLLALVSPWLLPLFVAADDPNAAQVIALGKLLLWLAACYQIFDGMNLGATFCLRGAGDVRVPAALVLVLALCFWVPLAHMLTFAPGEGWVDFLPQYGLGAVGGWSAAILYVSALGVVLLARWRSGAWRRITLR